ncbi:MAG: M48 family metallopeptidase [Candidatus Riflebacteria bacterium]|nr:M48 family metallopeptidase [Candidatus Riflebacteria bacterium]
MNPDKIEKLFWCLFIGWFILRICLLGCQFIGNTDPIFKQEVLKYFSESDIEAGRSYSLSGFWFKAVYGTIYMLALVLLLRFGFFNYLWQRVGNLVNEGLFKRDLVFTLTFFAFLHLLYFPSSFYLGYLMENAAGFSNIDLTGWFIRYFKVIGLNLLIQTAFFIVILYLIRYCPQKWPWVVPFVLTLTVAGSIILIPYIITPLFYNEKPLEKGELRDKLFELANKAELSVKEIYVIDESRYSKHTNAYFSGFGSFRRIVLYDNLIKSHTPDETALIFAHEAGHWKYNHMFWGVSCGFLGAIAICYLIYWIFDYLCLVKWFGLSNLSSASSIPFFMIAYLVLQLFFAPIESQISQFMETQADKSSIELTGLKDVFKNAQIRLAKDNKSDLLPHPFRVFWLYSHPIAIQRIHFAE